MKIDGAFRWLACMRVPRSLHFPTRRRDDPELSLADSPPGAPKQERSNDTALSSRWSRDDLGGGPYGLGSRPGARSVLPGLRPLVGALRGDGLGRWAEATPGRHGAPGCRWWWHRWRSTDGASRRERAGNLGSSNRESGRAATTGPCEARQWNVPGRTTSALSRGGCSPRRHRAEGPRTVAVCQVRRSRRAQRGEPLQTASDAR